MKGFCRVLDGFVFRVQGFCSLGVPARGVQSIAW